MIRFAIRCRRPADGFVLLPRLSARVVTGYGIVGPVWRVRWFKYEWLRLVIRRKACLSLFEVEAAAVQIAALWNEGNPK